MNESDKKRITQFIQDNELDFNIVDNPISRFHIIDYDGNKFHFEFYNENWVLVKYDPKKDDIFNTGSVPFEYFQFKTLSSLLEVLVNHDRSIMKTHWNLIQDSIEIGVHNYIDDWYNGIIEGNNWKIEDMETYKIISYTNELYKPQLKHPLNTLHEVSPINSLSYTTCEKLYFEIHPVNLLEGNESYLVKLLCNNDDIFKEYINYISYKKKGLKLFLETIFKDMERFKINSVSSENGTKSIHKGTNN